MAASPRHPLMHQLVLSLMNRLYGLTQVSDQFAPYITGPGALKMAFIHFMHAQTNKRLYERVKEGHYVGLGNRSVTVIGRKERSQEWVLRESVNGRDKIQGYAMMGMTHFNTAEKSARLRSGLRNESCLNRLYEKLDWKAYDD